MSTVKKIVKFLDKYNFEIVDHYNTEKDSNKHLFLLLDYIIHFDKKKKILDVSCKAGTDASIFANDVLILNEIPGIIDINIMEPYLIVKGNLISGKEAVDQWKTNYIDSIISSFVIQQQQMEWLIQEENLPEC